MSEKPAIKIFSMGGTIDKTVFSYQQLAYVVGEPQIERIINQSNVRFSFNIEPIAQKDSLELTNKDRTNLCQKIENCAEDKIIITHGTDTISNTAQALQHVTGKTIVFTGAMLPAKFFDTDAHFNIGGAVIAAQTLPAGLYLVINGLVLDPLTARKNTETSDYSVAR